MMIWDKVKSVFSRFVPSHVHDPFGLVRRMLRSKRKAAVFTLWLTFLGIVLIPLDLIFRFFEKRLQKFKPGLQQGPYIVVCGPARSGTTLVYQVLADNLDVAYIRNFTLLFSRSPVFASRLFTSRRKSKKTGAFESYYGKTAGMQSPSEANHLWNQWVGADASGFRTIMDSAGVEKMAEFFRHFSASQKLPLLVKNNNSNAFADTIAEKFDNCYFICLRRQADFLAQSLLLARLEINGDFKQSYGVVDVNSDQAETDPVTQVLSQVRFLDNLALEQQARIGQDKFWIIDYEDFCQNPLALVRRVKKEILAGKAGSQSVCSDTLNPMLNNNQVKDPALFRKIRGALKETKKEHQREIA